MADKAAFGYDERLIWFDTPESNTSASVIVFIDIALPSHLTLRVDAHWSSLDIADWTGVVTVESSHGTVGVFGCSGETNVTASHESVLTFCGKKGHVRLVGGQLVELKLTANRFEGTLQAVASGDIRLLAPKAFEQEISVGGHSPNLQSEGGTSIRLHTLMGLVSVAHY